MKRTQYAVIVVTGVVLALAGLAFAEPPASKHFVTHLDGGQEVPQRNTHATGQGGPDPADALGLVAAQGREPPSWAGCRR
jgi:hypothetical protein